MGLWPPKGDRSWTSELQTLGFPRAVGSWPPGLPRWPHCSPARERTEDGAGADVLGGERAGRRALSLTAPPTSHWAESLPLWLPQVLSHMPESRRASGGGVHPGPREGADARLRSSQFARYPRGDKARRLGNDVMLCVLDKSELYISCILKMSKIITLFWNSEDDSACMSLCR